MSTSISEQLLTAYNIKVAALQIIRREQYALDRLGGELADKSPWLKLYCELLSDERSFYSPSLFGKDKFAELVTLVCEPAVFGWRHYEAADLLMGIGLSTVRNWSRGTSRPSGVFISRFTPDLQDAALRISDRLAQEVTLRDTLPKSNEPREYETGGM